jgi:hypothetical protein
LTPFTIDLKKRAVASDDAEVTLADIRIGYLLNRLTESVDFLSWVDQVDVTSSEMSRYRIEVKFRTGRGGRRLVCTTLEYPPHGESVDHYLHILTDYCNNQCDTGGDVDEKHELSWVAGGESTALLHVDCEKWSKD